MGNRVVEDLIAEIERRRHRPWVISVFGEQHHIGIMRQWGPGEFVMVLCEREGGKHAPYSRGWRKAIREVISDQIRASTAGSC